MIIFSKQMFQISCNTFR